MVTRCGAMSIVMALSFGVPQFAAAERGETQPPSDPVVALSGTTDVPNPAPWQYGAFLDVGRLFSSTSPSNHLFRNRGTTPRLDTWDLNMTGAYLRKAPSASSRGGVEMTVQDGRDSEIFGF